MQPLFSTELMTHNEPVLYHVVFENNEYCFKPSEAASGAQEFGFVREHDEWQDRGTADAALRQQAIAKLEAYLLAQL